MDLSSDGIGTAIERIEDVRQLGRRNAIAVIAHRNPHFRTTTLTAVFDLDADPSIAPAVLNRVGDQVLNRRSKSGRVADDGRRVRDEIALDDDALRFEHGDGAL